MLDGHAADAAERWGTPLYLVDLDAAAARLAAYRAAFPGALIAYAVKANADPQLLRRLVADGAGCEVVTAVVLALALRAGCPGDRVVMNGIGKRDEELHLALAAGALVNAESLDELARLVTLAGDHEGARVGLRLNPALDAATHPHLATGAASAKFGISLGDLPRALVLLRQAGQSLACLGAHIGSGIDSLEPFAELATRLAAAVRDAAAAGLTPERIDLGGGLAGQIRRPWLPPSVPPSRTRPASSSSRADRWWPMPAGSSPASSAPSHGRRPAAATWWPMPA